MLFIDMPELKKSKSSSFYRGHFLSMALNTSTLLYTAGQSWSSQKLYEKRWERWKKMLQSSQEEGFWKLSFTWHFSKYFVGGRGLSFPPSLDRPPIDGTTLQLIVTKVLVNCPGAERWMEVRKAHLFLRRLQNNSELATIRCTSRDLFTNDVKKILQDSKHILVLFSLLRCVVGFVYYLASLYLKTQRRGKTNRRLGRQSCGFRVSVQIFWNSVLWSVTDDVII